MQHLLEPDPPQALWGSEHALVFMENSRISSPLVTTRAALTSGPRGRFVPRCHNHPHFSGGREWKGTICTPAHVFPVLADVWVQWCLRSKDLLDLVGSEGSGAPCGLLMWPYITSTNSNFPPILLALAALPLTPDDSVDLVFKTGCNILLEVSDQTPFHSSSPWAYQAWHCQCLLQLGTLLVYPPCSFLFVFPDHE